ncbi:MAG: S-layer homology domain-containing protein [Ruminococcaceae bacterium]|nr:S-layer homology domain-containing protein [Oscillospiraceae bacterium]
MLKCRKFIASVLTSIMTFSMMATAVFAAVPSDVANTKYEEAAEVLGVLNVMVGDDTGAFRPDDAIIRSEAAKVAVAISGLTEVANVTSGTTKYPDVFNGHWATGFINVATDQKMVVGDTAGTFRPDDKITYAEAVTILVRALGYEPQAQAKGGFPTGYLVTGSDIGLTKGVSGTQNKAVSRGDIARLAYNALTINMMEQTGFGNDVNYEVVEKTLLADKLNVEKIVGQVKAVGNASLDSSSNLNKNQILIEDEIYETGSADVRQVLGFTVDAYINEDGELLLARPSEGKNNSVTVPAENIAEITNTESKKELQYWADLDNDKKPTKEAIHKDATILYNGKAGTAEDFKEIDSGSITLLDTDTNGSHDVVFVNETVNYVVEEVVESSHKIVDKYGQKTLVADPEDETLTFVLVKGTERIEIGDLKEWDVITATISKDGDLVYAEVCNESVKGKISRKSNDTYYIDGKGYKVAKNYPNAVNLEDEGTFYLDVEGKIAAVDSETTVSSNYGYLVDANVSSGMDEYLEIKVFTKDGKTAIYKSGSKVKVNGTSALSPEDAFDAVKGDAEKIVGQLITFELNSSDEIKEINTATVSSTIDEGKFTMNMQEDDVVYNSASGKLVGSSMSVNVAKDTVVFDIPAGKTDSSDFAIRNSDFFVDGDKYNVLVFDVTEDRTANAIIVTNSTGIANEESAIAIVDEISQGRNEDGDDIEHLYAYQNGKKVEFTTVDTGILVKGDKALEQGDVIQIKTNAAGEIENITLLFDISTKDTEAEVEVSDKTTTYYGKVTKKFSTSFNMQVGDGTVHNFAIGDALVYEIDTAKSRNQITAADAGDIQKYDELDPSRVFVRVYNNVVQEIIIIK